MGLQVMAPPLADDRLYRVGAALEAALESDWGGPLLTAFLLIARAMPTFAIARVVPRRERCDDRAAV